MVHQRTRRTPQLAPLGVLFTVTAVAFGFFWSTAAARPLLLIVIGMVAAVVLDGIWSHHTLHDPDLEVLNPGDAMVGEVLPITVRLRGVGRTCQLIMRSMPGSPGAYVEPGQSGVLEVVPLTSGRFPWGIFELTARGPLGLVGWTRRLVVHLPQPIHVSPRFVPHHVELPAAFGTLPGQTAGATGQPDLVRSVHDYAPGDSSRTIHWSATARTGHLMVKELDPTGAGHLTIVVALDPADIGDGSEAAAGRAGHLAEVALAEGWTVSLVVRESDDEPSAVMPVLTSNRLPIRIVKRPAARSRPAVHPVRSRTEAARHLAAADFGPAEVPVRRPGAVRVVHSSGDDSWQ